MPSLPTDLDTLRGQLQDILADVNAKSWTTAALDEAIRLALTEIGNAAGEVFVINGLDTIADTSLPAQDRGALIIGATAYATASRSLDLAEKNSAGRNAVADLRQFSRDNMTLFNTQLERIRRRGLNNATSAPHQAMEWTERPPNFEGYGDGPTDTPPADDGELIL